MNKNWEVKKLGEVYDIRDGTHDSPKYNEEGFALITSKNLKNNTLDFKEIKYISEMDYNKINERSKVNQGDILFAMIGTIGNPVVIEVEPDFAIKNVALFKVPINQNSYFLKYFLDSQYVINKMKMDAKGTTQKFVGLGYLRDFKILLPPLSEQQRIVSILDESFDAINRAKANAEKNLQNARELFNSYLQSIFANPGEGWVARKLGDVCNIKHGYAFESQDFETDYNGEKPIVLTPGNFSENGKLYFNEKNTKRFNGECPNGFKFNTGDLVVVMTDLSSKMKILGKPAFIKDENILHNQRIGRFVFHEYSLA